MTIRRRRGSGTAGRGSGGGVGWATFDLESRSVVEEDYVRCDDYSGRFFLAQLRFLIRIAGFLRMWESRTGRLVTERLVVRPLDGVELFPDGEDALGWDRRGRLFRIPLRRGV